MKKRQAITLSIPNPCHVGWENMAATEKGRHCTSCNKTVIDFSNYTDKELADFFKSSNGRVCGRVSKFQLDRVIATPTNKRFPFLNKLAWGTAIASWLGLTSTANAQDSKKHIKTEYQELKTINAVDKIFAKESNDTSQYIERRILDDGGSPIYASITIAEAPMITGCSDIAGNFKLRLPDNFLNKQITLICSSENHWCEPLKVNLNKLPYTNIKIQLQSIVVMGIMIGRYEATKYYIDGVEYSKEDFDRIGQDPADIEDLYGLEHIPARYEGDMNSPLPTHSNTKFPK